MNPTRGQAAGVLHYVEGWLSGADHDAASDYLREHLDEIVDQMVDDECAIADADAETIRGLRERVAAVETLAERAREWVQYADESPHLEVFSGAWMHTTILRDLAVLARHERPEGKAVEVEELCIAFHDAYEAAAVREGWETQERSRKPWDEVPETNKATMRETLRAVLDRFTVTRKPEAGEQR